MLTRKQLDLLSFIHKHVQREGVPPSFDEMKDALDLRSKSGVHRLITALEERGFLRRLAHRARAIEIIRLPDALDGGEGGGARLHLLEGGGGPTAAVPGPRARGQASNAHVLEVPVMGRIAAGTPIDAIQHVSDTISVPGSMLSSGGRHYALEVRGDSMSGAGINNGDIVVIREQAHADNGDIVVALVEEAEATLKRLHRRGSAIALEAANPAYETRHYRDDQVRVQGRLVGLIRSY